MASRFLARSGVRSRSSRPTPTLRVGTRSLASVDVVDPVGRTASGGPSASAGRIETSPYSVVPGPALSSTLAKFSRACRDLFRHPRESGNPGEPAARQAPWMSKPTSWVPPACAGTTGIFLRRIHGPTSENSSSHKLSRLHEPRQKGPEPSRGVYENLAKVELRGCPTTGVFGWVALGSEPTVLPAKAGIQRWAAAGRKFGGQGSGCRRSDGLQSPLDGQTHFVGAPRFRGNDARAKAGGSGQSLTPSRTAATFCQEAGR
jgi:hypothetical protein